MSLTHSLTLPVVSQRSIVETPATAELEPITAEHRQVSEDDMGMTFPELSTYGRLRKIAMVSVVLQRSSVAHDFTPHPP